MKSKIKQVKSILLSAPYATADNMEVQLHLPTGYRTCGMVEITLDNGFTGIGEGYLAVFAPLVFKEIVQLTAPYIEGRYLEDYTQIIADLQVVTGYWSRQGAARHVLSAIDIALYDLLAQTAGKPLFKYLNPEAGNSLKLYASGGDSQNPAGMMQELDEVQCLGIQSFKIRAREEQVDKVNWCIRHAGEKDIKIAIDMTQNLVVTGQTIEDVIRFRKSLCDQPVFIEEPLGPVRIHEYPSLRQQIDCPIAGGEIITHPDEMTNYILKSYYDIAQPDATVIGGISAMKSVFEKSCVTDIFVHCWGGAVGMAANYHVAAAFGGSMVEWPLPEFTLRTGMLTDHWPIIAGMLYLPDVPGLGVKLTNDIIASFPFRNEAVYSCLPKVNSDKKNLWTT